jgi:hypothetical protein
MYVEFVSLPLATQKDPICIGDPTTIRTSPVVVAAVVTERHTETERERERENLDPPLRSQPHEE